MSARRRPPARPRVTGRGERFLDRSAPVVVVLEDGSEYSADLSAELEVPDDLTAARRELETATARYAFWSYQYNRAQLAAKRVDRLAAREEAASWFWYKKEFDETFGPGRYTFNIIERRVDADQLVLDIRCQRDDAQHHADTLRTIRDATQHRIFALRTLITHSDRD